MTIKLTNLNKKRIMGTEEKRMVTEMKKVTNLIPKNQKKKKKNRIEPT
jgi:hypothetical protein